MPFFPRTIGPAERLGVSSETIRALHRELGGTASRYGALDLRERDSARTK